MRPRIRALLVAAALVASAPAMALSPEAAKAEQVRLRQEMRKLAKRNAWHGVEKQYVAMLELESDGVKLQFRDHFTGAQAARELGRITDVYTRLKRAVELKPDEAEASAWLAEIQASYASVLLAADDRYKGGSDLAPAAMPFDPAKRAAIGAAQATLAETNRYEGLLPHGEYTYGGKAFTVAASDSVVEVILVPEGGNAAKVARGDRRDGLRFGIGAGLANVASTYGGGVTEGLQPTEGRSGGLLRGTLGGGFQLGDSPAGLFFEAGYHGMFPETVTGNGQLAVSEDGFTPVTADGQATMNLGFLQLGPTLWLADQVELALAVGWGFGTISLVSPVDCLGGDCGGASSGVADVVTGRTVMPGASLGATWAPQPLTFNLLRGTYGVGVGLQGGLWRDDARSYPWGQVGLTVLPSLTSR